MSIGDKLSTSLYTGFIDGSTVSLEEYQPKLLVNDSKNGEKVLTNLIDELRVCDEFFFSVAFITNSGVASLISILKELEDKGVKGKIIASQYQNFTEPRALKRLCKLKNIQLRIVTEGNFHAKGYIFKRGDAYSLIVGSSNLTQNALAVNKEWNIKVSSTSKGSLIVNTLKEFQYTFDNATVVDDLWIEEYKKIYYDNQEMRKSNELNTYNSLENKGEYNTTYTQGAHRLGEKQIDVNKNVKIHNIRRISPNKMQVEALTSLEHVREQNKDRALLISATGTGKTYLSAFDVKRYKPSKFLFVVHRENIARAAMNSYKTIFGQTYSMGLLSGTSKAWNADFIFSTIQTLSKDNVLYRFKKNCFDYIVIDEVHRSGAESYQKIIKYFEPKFLLGMSATPERTDGYDIYKDFNYNIAYEIRLNRALEENMLVPFHYYGISDIEVDGELLDDKASFNKLTCNERVDKIIRNSEFYGCDRGRIKGLIFCSRTEEAHKLSDELNLRGYRTIALDGSSSEELREECIKRLEKDGGYDVLDYIFTVDIFNEGVDIPAVNQIIMLRPTQSAIIFVQQLGRGLRKYPDKEYLTVIDFIGNYSNNYLVPIALYGDNSYNKDNIRKLINNESSYMPGASTVNFDYITRQKIFDAINVSNLSTRKDLFNDYQLLKFKLGKIPSMMDFVNHGSRDPFAYVNYSGSYYAFVLKYDNDMQPSLSSVELKNLEFYSKEVCNAKEVAENVMLKLVLEKHEIYIQDYINHMNKEYGYKPTVEDVKYDIKYLNADFLKQQDKDKYLLKETVCLNGDKMVQSKDLIQLLKNSEFKKYLCDALNYSIDKYNKDCAKSKNCNGFILYGKYSRKDVCRILKWEKDESSTMYGYRIKYNTCPIFVTYNKQEDINESTKYEDMFINNRQFSWMTRNKVTLDSKEAMDIKGYKTNGLRISLFVKKSDGEGSDFYYMGDMEPCDFNQVTIKNGDGQELPIVNIRFNMKEIVDNNMMNYLREN